ncbi:MAG: class I SAM-dependent methyltransferase [Phycisphaerales bacterium]|nr:class I SAM-dependent methyltransferase [Phycisphaerales bacterium]
MDRSRPTLSLPLSAILLLGTPLIAAAKAASGPPGVPNVGETSTPAKAPESKPAVAVESDETRRRNTPSPKEVVAAFDLRELEIDPRDFESIQKVTGITLSDFDSKDSIRFELELLRQAVGRQAMVERHGAWIVARGSEAGVREAARVRAAVADFISAPIAFQCSIIRIPRDDPDSAAALAEWQMAPITAKMLDRLEADSSVTELLARPTVTTRLGQPASLRIEPEDEKDLTIQIKAVRLEKGELELEVEFEIASEMTLGRLREREGVQANTTIRIPPDGIGLVFGRPFATAVVRELDGGRRTIDRPAPTDQDHILIAIERAPTGEAARDTTSIYGSCDPTRDGTGKTYFDREIAQVMGHLAAGWLERPEREREERTDLLIRMLGLRPGMVVADIGAGSGYFTRRMAPPLEPGGSVFATDIQPEMLEYLQTSLALEGIRNVVPILGRVDDTGLAEDSVDLILLVDVYHEFDHPWEMARSMHRALRPNGRVALVEYRAGDDTVPIKPLHTMTEAQARLEFEAAGFEMVESLVDGLPWQRLMIFEPRADVAMESTRSSTN